EERPWLTNLTPRSITIRTMRLSSISTKRPTPRTSRTTSRRMKISSLARLPTRLTKTPPTKSLTRPRTKSQRRSSNGHLHRRLQGRTFLYLRPPAGRVGRNGLLSVRLQVQGWREPRHLQLPVGSRRSHHFPPR